MLRAGVARRGITPFWGVELTGWGYFIQRRWQRIRDELNATALVLDDGARQIAIVALDLMVIDDRFTAATRQRIAQWTGIAPDCVLLACSHSHNAPSAGGLLGAGECDPDYEDWASRQAATAVALAWSRLTEVEASVSHAELPDISYNRTRDGGAVDTRLTTLRLDRRDDGRPLAMVANFQAHPCVYTRLCPTDVTRDVPGETCDLLEAALPGCTALYLQGASGDVNFHGRYVSPRRASEPARALAGAALECQTRAKVLSDPVVAGITLTAELPTRRWQRDEIFQPREEALRRMETGDTRGWLEGIGRAMTNHPPDMIARHGGDEVKAVRAMARFFIQWSDQALKDWETRPEVLHTEVQALRVGNLFIAANASEFFTSFALELRRRCGEAGELMIAGYSNGRIGYLPDAHDIARRSYAAYQSPKYCFQFPFVESSGPAMVAAMHDAVERAAEVR